MAQFSKALFSHPFSRAYWKEASAETRRVRILAIAALCCLKNGHRFVPDPGGRQSLYLILPT